MTSGKNRISQESESTLTPNQSSFLLTNCIHTFLLLHLRWMRVDSVFFFFFSLVENSTQLLTDWLTESRELPVAIAIAQSSASHLCVKVYVSFGASEFMLQSNRLRLRKRPPLTGHKRRTARTLLPHTHKHVLHHQFRFSRNFPTGSQFNFSPHFFHFYRAAFMPMTSVTECGED